MARRSSARLRNRNSSTPKRVSLSHDAPGRTPRTAPVKLTALKESDEMPGAFPQSVSPPSMLTTYAAADRYSKIPVNFGDATPKDRTPIRPSDEEMHPKQHQHSTAKPLEEARWLGFTNMVPNTEPSKQTNKLATLQGTPTKVPKDASNVGSPRFEFTFGREVSLELSPEAKKLMYEKREEAAKIREQMVADGDGPKDVTELLGRKIATPKGKKGRFSDVHSQHFNKMESIAGHASSFRADPNRTKSIVTPSQRQADMQKAVPSTPIPSKSLKRSPSKAQLDGPEQARAFSIPRSASKSMLTLTPGRLPHPQSSIIQHSRDQSDDNSPSKRVKRSEADDASTGRSSSSDVQSTPATPQPLHKTPTKKVASAEISKFTSPTQASLARTASIKSAKSSKIPAPAPALSRTPSKPAFKDTNKDSPKATTPLLARSPSKMSLFEHTGAEKPASAMSLLLMRTPVKGSPFKKTTDINETEPMTKATPLLSRSPLKMSVANSAASELTTEKPSSFVPFLARSPAKVALPANIDESSTQTPTKSSGGNLMNRFGLLRASPMKSILRSPQRLYSNDPAKVAAGTHLATPPRPNQNLNKPLPTAPTAETSVEKHVDFTSSTKARYERAQSEAASSSSKGSDSPPKPVFDTKSAPKPIFTAYPTLPSDETAANVTPFKRRQTAAPGDFTFTSHGHGIVFGQSPNAPPSAAIAKRTSTIRHVSAEPQLPPPPPATGSKKRKFEFENDMTADTEMTNAASNKENTEEIEEERPAKRVKQSAPESLTAKPASRVPTLGVKPRKNTNDGRDKRPATISKARLNALAQPKRRT